MSDTPAKLALVGYGRMGQLVEQLAPSHGFEVTSRLDEYNNPGGVALTEENFSGIDAAIDFSIPDVVADNAVRMAELGVQLAIGTTGWTDEIDRVREAVERHGTGLVYGANFSVGVNAFYRVVQAAAQALATQEDYDAFMYEAHHKYKKDAPSGTALRLLDAMRDAGYSRPVDVATQRAGQFPGVHEIGFDSEADTIRVSHSARNRSGFAHGALKAARWVMGRRGFFEFSTVWDQLG